MTQTMTKEQIIKKRYQFYDENISHKDIELCGEQVQELMEEYAQQQLSAERERLEALIKNEPVSFFLVNIMRNLPNDKWPDLINALNERCSLPTAERERAGKLVSALNEYIVLLGEELDEVMGFVNAHQWESTRFEKGEELRQKIKQTLNEYDTATKES